MVRPWSGRSCATDSFTTPARESEGHQEFRGADVVQMGKSRATGPPPGPTCNATTRNFFGADDGIRTRDPHLGKKKGDAQRPER